MFHKILVAIDRSEMGQKVFEEALSLAQATGAKLMLLNVLSPTEEASPTMPGLIGTDFYPGGLSRSVIEIYQELWNEYAAKGLEILRSLTEKATAAGVTTEFTQNTGTPGPMICALAKTQNVDLIVMGRRGHSGLNELFLGSVSNYVLHHAPCAVLTLHPLKLNSSSKPVTQQAVAAE